LPCAKMFRPRPPGPTHPLLHPDTRYHTNLKAHQCTQKSTAVVVLYRGEGVGTYLPVSHSLPGGPCTCSSDVWPAKWLPGGCGSWSSRHGDGPCSTSEVPSSMPSTAEQHRDQRTHREVSGSGLCKALSAQYTKRISGCQHGWPPLFF
jgi:hypothetical protein